MRDIRNNNNYNNLMETGTGIGTEANAISARYIGPGGRVPEIDELGR